MMLKTIEDVSVIFKNVTFNRATVLVPNQQTRFYVNILIKTGNFEIFESGVLVSTGNIKLLNNFETEYEDAGEHFKSNMIKKHDFYKQFKLKGYNYKDIFRGVMKFDLNNNEGSVQWKEKFDFF